MQRSREGRFVLIGIVTLDTQDIPTSLFDHRAMSSPSMSLKAYVFELAEDLVHEASVSPHELTCHHGSRK